MNKTVKNTKSTKNNIKNSSKTAPSTRKGCPVRNGEVFAEQGGIQPFGKAPFGSMVVYGD